ncbi:MAG: hypothetical protein F9K29_22625 [Hyphomicrobiaceae bacterium]|nr:MAG: hypothetical protein F9K29_22625 [Hyphomicrobiaceae bacterium]
MAPVELKTVLLVAALNPVVVLVAVLMGRSASQWQKLPVAAFAAALAGSALIWLAVWAGVSSVAGVGRAAAGVFVAEFVFGLLWAAIGYQWGQRRR